MDNQQYIVISDIDKIYKCLECSQIPFDGFLGYMKGIICHKCEKGAKKDTRKLSDLETELIKNAVAKVQVKCSYCSEILSYYQFDEHLAFNCEEFIHFCQNTGCNYSGKKKEYDKHKTECIYRCEVIMKIEELNERIKKLETKNIDSGDIGLIGLSGPYTQYVKFSKPFVKIPKVNVGIQSINANYDLEDKIKISVNIGDVSKSGFYIHLNSNLQMNNLTIWWMAYF